MRTRQTFVFAGAALYLALSFSAGAQELSGKVELQTGWRIVSEKDANAGGVDMSTTLLGDKGHAIERMPSTVLNSLAKAGVYEDIYYGDNIVKVGQDLWQQRWWYQTELDVPAGHERYTLIFNGINSRGEIWLNGQPIAGSDEISGMNRRYEFDVTDIVRPGESNILAVRVTPEQKTPGVTLGDNLARSDGEGLEMTDTWIDWINPKYLGNIKELASFVPDKNAGIWRKVYLTYGGDVAIRNPYVKSDLEVPSLESAKLDVFADLTNYASEPVSGILRGEITREGKPGILLEKQVTLQANETREETFTSSDVAELTVSKPDVWWPYTWGEPNLYDLKLSFVIDDKVSDEAGTRFGIRKVTQHRDDTKLFPEFKNPGAFYLKVNGIDYLIRGAAYTPDLLFNNDPKKDREIMRYAKDLGVNMLRWEGKFADDDMLQLADEQGMPVMQGLPCCGSWELWSHWDANNYKTAYASVTDTIKNLRPHASAFIWANGSDGRPPENVLSKYYGILKDLNWQNAVIDTVSTRNADWSGVNMLGPYNWRSPTFWFKDIGMLATQGSVAEEGSSETIPPLESLKKFIPEDKLWPVTNAFWELRSGAAPGNNTLSSIRDAIDHRYGKPDNVEDFAKRAQLAIYENVRAQNEAYGALGWETHKMTIFWMLNNHWPSFFGHLFDYYMKQGGGYYAAKKALQPLSVVFDGYAKGDRTKANVYLVNQSLQEREGLVVAASFYDLDGKLRYEEKSQAVSAPSRTSNIVLTLPRHDDMGPVYFVRLQLLDADGKRITENTYWQSSKDDIPVDMDPNSLMDAMTMKQDQWADFTALNSMPRAPLERAVQELDPTGDYRNFRITLKNPSEHIAFFVRAELRLDEKSGEILPITYSDNYVTVYPGETVEVGAQVARSQMPAVEPLLFAEGYNVKPE